MVPPLPAVLRPVLRDRVFDGTFRPRVPAADKRRRNRGVDSATSAEPLWTTTTEWAADRIFRSRSVERWTTDACRDKPVRETFSPVGGLCASRSPGRCECSSALLQKKICQYYCLTIRISSGFLLGPNFSTLMHWKLAKMSLDQQSRKLEKRITRC